MPGSPSPRRAKRRAVIIGGSMSGLFSAAFLRQIGWDVDVYERSSVELVGRGAGITTHPELLETLEASGAGTTDLGVEVPKRIAIDREGRITDERPLRQILTSWDRLQRLLRETIDEAHYHLGWNFERVDQDERGVRVHFSGGRVEHADILVGGDGIRSERARANGAGGAADLCRLLHLARRTQRSRSRAGDARTDLSAVHLLPAQAAAGDQLSDRRLRQRSAARASAASISSGIASPTPTSCAICASTKTAYSTNIRCRRR